MLHQIHRSYQEWGKQVSLTTHKDADICHGKVDHRLQDYTAAMKSYYAG